MYVVVSPETIVMVTTSDSVEDEKSIDTSDRSADFITSSSYATPYTEE